MKRLSIFIMILMVMFLTYQAIVYATPSPEATLRVSLPAGTKTGPSDDKWLNEVWLLTLSGNSWTFTLRINETSKAFSSYDTHLVVALNDVGYSNLLSLTIDSTSIPKSAFQYGKPKPYNIWNWPAGDVYKYTTTRFNDTLVNLGTIPPKGYKDVTVSVTFSDATNARIHFDAYGSRVYPPPPPNKGKVVRNSLSSDSTVMSTVAPPAYGPSACFTESPETPCVGQTVTFDASCSQPGFDGDNVTLITEYRWDFDGDGNVDSVTSSPTATYTYTATGTYTVNLTVYAPGVLPNIDSSYVGTDIFLHDKIVCGPPPPLAIHLDAEPPILIDLKKPLSTQWHELYPNYCNKYHLSGWFDTNGNGVLDHCDYIILEDEATGKLGWYHVERVTVTILVTRKVEPFDSMYIEFDGDIQDFPFHDPVCTIWHEVYSDYCNWFHLSSWEDTDLSGDLNPSDQIDMEPVEPPGPIEWWHVDEVKTDILVTFVKHPDFGDAPDPFMITPGKYPSLLANNGALHIDWNYEWLGANVNGELDSKQVDLDEFDDGVIIAGDLVLGGNLQLIITISTSGQPGRYDITDSNKVMYLNAWIDWNRDGDWEDAGEKIIGTGSPTGTQKFAGPTTPVYNVPIPGSAEIGETWLRFRLDYAEDAGANPQLWTDPSLNQEKGQAMYGEVEDCKITIEEAPPPANLKAVSQSVSPSTVTQGETVHITVKVKNTGTVTLTFNVDLKYDGTLLHTWTGVTLPSGAQKDLTWDWDTSGVPPGTYSITVMVDPANAIAETDETDNTCTITAAVTIESPPPPPPPPPVGGVWVPINKFALLAPWIGLASLITVAAVSIVYVNHRKKRQN